MRALRYRFFFQSRFPPFGDVLQIPRVRVVVTDLLLLSIVIISIITDAKNARRYHRGGLVAARRHVLLSSLFQQFQLSAQARRLGELMEKLTHGDAISTRPSFTRSRSLLCEIRLFSGREQKEVHFMCIDDASSRFSSLGGFARVVSLSLSLRKCVVFPN